jgi:hypothetical protein
VPDIAQLPGPTGIREAPLEDALPPRHGVQEITPIMRGETTSRASSKRR